MPRGTRANSRRKSRKPERKQRSQDGYDRREVRRGKAPIEGESLGIKYSHRAIRGLLRTKYPKDSSKTEQPDRPTRQKADLEETTRGWAWCWSRCGGKGLCCCAGGFRRLGAGWVTAPAIITAALRGRMGRSGLRYRQVTRQALLHTPSVVASYAPSLF